MKKIISVILLLAILTVAFSSCGKNPDNSVDYTNDRYIYRVDGVTLYRYDVVDKVATIACPDGLCDHGDDCLVKNITMYTITDKYIFLCREASIHNVQILVYDLTKNEIKEIAQTDGQTNLVTLINNYAYFPMSHYEYEDGKISKEVFNLYRYNTSTETLEIINDEPLLGEIYSVGYDEERIIWYGTRYGSYFSSDYNFDNISDEKDYTPKISIGDFEYNIPRKKDEYGSYFKAERTNIKTGKTEVLYEEAESIRWANKKTMGGILFRDTEIVSQEIDGEEKLVRVGNKRLFYISTSDPSTSFEINLPDNIETGAIHAYSGELWYVGDYTSTTVYVHSTDSTGTYTSQAMLVINTKTGDYFIIENEDTKSLSRVQATE